MTASTFNDQCAGSSFLLKYLAPEVAVGPILRKVKMLKVYHQEAYTKSTPLLDNLSMNQHRTIYQHAPRITGSLDRLLLPSPQIPPLNFF